MYCRRVVGVPNRAEIVLTRDKLEEKTIEGERGKRKFVYISSRTFTNTFLK